MVLARRIIALIPTSRTNTDQNGFHVTHEFPAHMLGVRRVDASKAASVRILD